MLIWSILLLLGIGSGGYVRTATAADVVAFLPNATNTIASCSTARIVDNSQKFCSMASWTSARLYIAATFGDYDLGTELTDIQQNALALNLYNGFKNNHLKPMSNECSQALTRLACVTAFPECSLSTSSGTSISYYMPCRLQCEQANARCPFITNCDLYPATSCMLSIPTGFFVIDPLSGPFEPLVIIYSIALAFWVIFAITWNYLTFVRYKNACVPFCRVVSGIPIIKGKSVVWYYN